MKYTQLPLLLAPMVLAGSLQGAIVWTGAADDDLFNDANWDFSGAVNGTSAVDPNVTIDEDMQITGAIVTGATGGGFGQLSIGDGFSLTLTNSSLTMAGTDGIAGVDDGAGSARINSPAVVNLIGSGLDIQFASIGVDFNVDGTSTLAFRGGGDPINSQTELTQVHVSAGGTLTLASAAEFTEQGQDILVNGNVYDVDGNGVAPSDDTLWDSLGATRVAAAVPEPSSVLLLGLGGLATLLRRRK